MSLTKSVICLPRAFWRDLAAQLVKTLPAAQETWVPSLDQEDPLEKGMANTPVFLPGQSHGQRSLVGYNLWGCKEMDTTEHTHTHTHCVLECIFKVNLIYVLQTYHTC